MRRLAAWLSLALGQTADLMATVTATSSGAATEANPFFHSPEAWLTAKVMSVVAVAAILASRNSTRLNRTALWLGLACSAVAVWNWTQSFGGWW